MRQEFAPAAVWRNTPRTRPQRTDRRLAWSVSYGDVTTLLLVFFVLLISASSVDFYKLSELQHHLAGTQARPTPLGEISATLARTLELHQLADDVQVRVDHDGVRVVMKDSLLFASGSSQVPPASVEKTLPLFAALGELPKKYRFAIEGHSDDVPIKTEAHPSNWHLSAARALATMELFERAGTPVSRVSVHGYGDTRPQVPNRDSAGRPIVENRRQNRRVVIRIN